MSRHESVFCSKFFIYLHCEGAKYMNEAEIVFVVSKKITLQNNMFFKNHQFDTCRTLILLISIDQHDIYF